MSAENLGPADEWGILTEEIKRMEDRKAALRPVLLGDAEARHGKRYIVTPVSFTRDIVDVDKALLERAFPEAYRATVSIMRKEQTNLQLSGVTEDGEQISLRELRRIVASQEAK